MGMHMVPEEVLEETTEYPEIPPPDNPFMYGWRYVWQQQADGSEDLVQVPLTLEDVLHPQMEDYVLQSNDHVKLCIYLYNVLRLRLRDDPSALVLYDVLVEWGIAGMKAHGPDIAVFRGVREHPGKGSFRLRELGGEPVLIIEVTSKATRVLDVNSTRERNKFRQYAQIGVPFYVIIDEANRHAGEPPAIYFYRLQGSAYAPIPTDPQGGAWLAPVGMRLGPLDSWVAWFDEENEPYAGYEEVAWARAEAEERAQAYMAYWEEEQERARAYMAYWEEEQGRAQEYAEQWEEEKQRALEYAEQWAEEKQRAQEYAEQWEEEKQRAQEYAEQWAEEKQRALEERKRAEAAEQRLREMEAEMARLRDKQQGGEG